MRATWNTLPEDRHAGLDGLVIEHNMFWSREQIGLRLEDFGEETRSGRGPVQHPQVRRHRRTGQASLCLASHASHVIGRPVAEGRALLRGRGARAGLSARARWIVRAAGFRCALV